MRSLFPNARIVATQAALPLELLACIPDEDERRDVLELGGMSCTATLYVQNTDTGKLMAYAVLSTTTEEGKVLIMRARSFLTGLGKAALAGIFKGAQTVSKPLTVHADSLRGFARMMGAEEALAGLDADGVRMGVFNGK